MIVCGPVPLRKRMTAHEAATVIAMEDVDARQIGSTR
jgi:hypothetical protein